MSKRMDTYEDGSGGFRMVVAHGKYLTGFRGRKPVWGAARQAILFRREVDCCSGLFGDEQGAKAWKLLQDYPCAEQVEVALFLVHPE